MDREIFEEFKRINALLRMLEEEARSANARIKKIENWVSGLEWRVLFMEEADLIVDF